MTVALGSIKHEHVAFDLTNRFFAGLEQDDRYRNIVGLLREARNEVWPDLLPDKNSFHKRIESRKEEFRHILERLTNDDDRTHFMEAFAKMGHLYETAGLLARSKFFDEVRAVEKITPHGTEEYLSGFASAKDAVERLNKPIFEATFTSHPTNNNTLEGMNALRELGRASTELRSHDSPENQKRFDDAMKTFIAAPLVPLDEKKEDFNVGIRGETREMLNFLGNIYEDLPGAYREFDKALAKKADYDPLALRLNFRFNSWGSSGDKDGNKRVSSDTTLEAAYMHTLKATSLLSEELDRLKLPALDSWKKDLSRKRDELDSIRKTITNEYRKPCKPIPEETFDTFSRKLADLTFDARALETDAASAYKAMRGHRTRDEEQKRELLTFIRRVRTFGPHMGKIEYRETSEEFSRIVGMMVPEYKKLVTQDGELLKRKNDKNAKLGEQALKEIDGQREEIEQKRIELLKGLLEGGRDEATGLTGPQSVLAALRGRIHAEGFGHNFDLAPDGKDTIPYKKDEAIAYHTLKRLELARDNPSLVSNHVLAECQGVSNKLELQFLMEALEKDGNRPTLGIIPLYEDPEVMQRVGKLEADSYRNSAYLRHLNEVAKAHPDEAVEGRPTQQVQFAHSDNRRRGGPAAAVGFIDEAHRAFHAAAAACGVETRDYEGGSLSDVFRNGLRSVSAMVNEFGLYKFTKLTFQGGDLHNYFSLPHATERLLSRSITHSAKHYDDKTPPTDLTHDPFSHLAVKALQATRQDYEDHIFQTGNIGIIIANAGFEAQEMKAGNTRSRGQRDPNSIFASVKVPLAEKKQVSFGKVTAVKMAAANPDKIRTISFSELLEHAGVYPTWLGTRTIEDNIIAKAPATLDLLNAKSIGQTLSEDEKELQFQLSQTQKNHRVSPKLMQLLYRKSAAFRENIDRMAFGISMSNLHTLEELHPALRETRFMKEMNEEYLVASQMVFKAMDGNQHIAPTGKDATAAMRQAVTGYLEHLRPTMVRKRNYMEFINYFKGDWKEKHPNQKVPIHLLRVVHCGMDIGTHGIYLMASDPRYAEMYHGNSLPGQGYRLGGNGASTGLAR